MPPLIKYMALLPLHVSSFMLLMQGVDLSAEHGPAAEYLKRLQSRQSWKNTFYSEGLVNEGWKAHLEG